MRRRMQLALSDTHTGWPVGVEIADLELTGGDIRREQSVGPGLTQLAVVRVGERFDVDTDQIGGLRSTMAPKEALACRTTPSGSIRQMPMGAPSKEPRKRASASTRAAFGLLLGAEYPPDQLNGEDETGQWPARPAPGQTAGGPGSGSRRWRFRADPAPMSAMLMMMAGLVVSAPADRMQSATPKTRPTTRVGPHPTA